MKYIPLTLISTILFVGCVSKDPNPVVYEKNIYPTQHINPTPQYTPEQKTLPKRAHKRIKLKPVEDTNYSTHYMYPEDTKAAKKDPVVPNTNVASTMPSMTKEACITMIGQEKFNRYTTMLGSEDSSIRRCAILKALKK